MQRTLIGIAAIVLLAASAVLWFVDPNSGSLAATLKLGLMLAVMWLALPDAQRGANPYLILGTVICVIVLFTRPLYFPIAVAVLFVLFLLRPRTPRPR